MKKNKKFLIPLIGGLSLATTIVAPLLTSCSNGGGTQPAVEGSISLGRVPSDIGVKLNVIDRTSRTISVMYNDGKTTVNVIDAPAGHLNFSFWNGDSPAIGFKVTDDKKIEWNSQGSVPATYNNKDITIKAKYTNQDGKTFETATIFKVHIINQ